MLDVKRWFPFSFLGHPVNTHPRAMIEPYAEQRKAGAVILGLASDLSLSDYDIYTGAKEGPDAIRQMLTRTPYSGALPIYDAGVIEAQSYFGVKEDEFDTMRSAQYAKLCSMLKLGHLPVMLGGGHEVAIGSYQALSDTVNQAGNDSSGEESHILPFLEGNRIGIINIDANFQLRRSLAVKAGSAFHSVAAFCHANNRTFRYLGLGMCDHINSQATLAYASELGAQWLLDSEMKMKNRKRIQAVVAKYLEQVDHIHLSIDLSVFSSAIAGGASLSRVFGVNLAVVEMVISQAMASNKVRLVDIAGLNPEYDYLNQTARLAVSLLHHVLKAR